MNKTSLIDRLRYAFDNVMSKGTVALIGWLALLTMCVTFTIALVVAKTISEVDFTEQFWAYTMLTLDADAMTDASWPLRLAGLFVTLTGVFVTSILVGLLAAGIESKLENLRKGRSRVIETNHTIILGWSSQVFHIIQELVVANANRRRACIVILGDKDKVEMEDEIRDKVGDTGHTRIVCRRGNPMEMADLGIVGLNAARSIIILASEGDNPDSSTIKTLLAITKNPGRRSKPYHIVAEIHDPKNLEAARIVGQDETELVFTGELVARIMAQTCRQSGLSVVYSELMDFAGDEIYFQSEPALTGKTFGEALLAYEDSAVLGLRPKGGQPKLNPPMETLIREGDQVIAISEDDDTVVVSELEDYEIEESAICTAQPGAPVPERILLLGWNWRAPTIINELDNYVAPGSQITVVADSAEREAQLTLHCAELENQTVMFQQADITDRRTLDSLPFETIDHVILLSYSDLFAPQQADARTLITLLHLRDIADQEEHEFSIVSEILDLKNKELAEVTQADDFVVSDRVISLILSQISENKALGAVFADLFDPDGSEIYLKASGDYVAPGERLNFYTVMESARRRGEVALGYRLHAYAQDAARSYGVVVNPDKSAAVTFEEQDRIIVLAER